MLRERLPQQSGWVNFGRRLPRKVGQFCTPINTYLLSCNIDSPNRERSIDWHADRHRTSTPTNSQSDRKGSNSPKPIRVNCWPTCCAARIALRDFRLATHRVPFSFSILEPIPCAALSLPSSDNFFAISRAKRKVNGVCFGVWSFNCL